MTILSKKKSNQNKSEEQLDSSTHHGGTHTLNLTSVQNHSQGTGEGEGLCLRLRENTENHERHERHDRLNSKFPVGLPREDGHESGPSHSNSKRRHRSSPHRTNRNKLRERNASSPPTFSGNSNVGSSPQAGPSGTGDDCDRTSGYNSGDEYGPCQGQALAEGDWSERDRYFEKIIKRKGFVIKKMEEDGACLFRAVADQVYGDQEMHTVVRNHCMDYIAANGDYFSHYVTEDFDRYVNRKRRDYVHGNHIEMQAMSEMYNRTVEVFCYGSEPINIFHGKHKTDNEPIRLSYQRGSHYNSIVDPYKATIGVGLGLPSYTPGLAEKNLMKDAVNMSENFHIEQTMLEDKLRATDWEATNEAIEEQVARESYLQWLRDNEKRNSSKRAASETCSSATITSTELRSSPRARVSGINSPSYSGTHQNSTKACSNEDPATSSSSSNEIDHGNYKQYKEFQLLETASFLNHESSDLFGLSDWDDADILAQVMAASQQEYIDNLKKQRESNEASSSVCKRDNCSDFAKPSTSRWASTVFSFLRRRTSRHSTMELQRFGSILRMQQFPQPFTGDQCQ